MLDRPNFGQKLLGSKSPWNLFIKNPRLLLPTYQGVLQKQYYKSSIFQTWETPDENTRQKPWLQSTRIELGMRDVVNVIDTINANRSTTLQITFTKGPLRGASVGSFRENSTIVIVVGSVSAIH